MLQEYTPTSIANAKFKSIAVIIFSYLAAALNPTEIMNTHPEMVMLQTHKPIRLIDGLSHHLNRPCNQ
jgi:hypothetical protein